MSVSSSRRLIGALAAASPSIEHGARLAEPRGPRRLRGNPAHSGGGRRRGAPAAESSAWRGGRAGSRCSSCMRTPEGQSDTRGHRHPGRRGPHAEHARHRPRSGGSRADERGYIRCQRSAEDDRREHLGDRRVRRQPAVHSHLARRLSRDPRQPGGRQSDDGGPAGALLHVHRPAARAGRHERDGGRTTAASMSRGVKLPMTAAVLRTRTTSETATVHEGAYR